MRVFSRRPRPPSAARLQRRFPARRKCARVSGLQGMRGRTVVVGIGHGAGGGEPLQGLVRGLSAGRGLAVVVVQYAGPEVLPGACALRVVRAEDGMLLQPDCLYVVPRTHLPSLSGGRFLLEEIASCEGLRMPIDHFLRSLAGQEGSACCGVLLSGEGPDGTLGLSEIKAAGGRTLRGGRLVPAPHRALPHARGEDRGRGRHLHRHVGAEGRRGGVRAARLLPRAQSGPDRRSGPPGLRQRSRGRRGVL